MATKTQEIYSVVKGASESAPVLVADIAKHTGHSEAYVSSVLTTTMKRPSKALVRSKLCLRRKQFGSNPVKYGYWFGKATEPAPVVKEPPKPIPLGITPTPKLPQGDTFADAVDAMVDALAEAVRPRLRAALAAMIVAEVPKITYLPPPDAPEAAAPATRLPSVLIVGMMPANVGQIAAEFSQALVIDSVDADARKIVDKAKQKDAVFVYTSHIPHKLTEELKSAGVAYRYVNGGMTKMREALRSYLLENAA